MLGLGLGGASVSVPVFLKHLTKDLPAGLLMVSTYWIDHDRSTLPSSIVPFEVFEDHSQMIIGDDYP